MKKFFTSRFFAIVALVASLFLCVTVNAEAAAGFYVVSNLAAFGYGVDFTVCGVRLPLKLPDPSGNMAINGKVTFDNPRGVAYHDIMYHFQDGGVDMTVAQMKARVTSITQKFNGRAVREWTPTSLDIANSTNGAKFAASNGYLRDYFSEPWRRTIEGEERNALGTAGLAQFTTEILFNGAGTAPTVEAYAVYDEKNRPFNAYPFRHIRTYSAQPVINGDQQWPAAGPERRVGLWYDRIHFLSALVTKVRIEMDKNPKWDSIPLALATEYLAKSGLAMQANTYTVAFTGFSTQFTDALPSFKDAGNGTLVPVENFLLKWTGSGAGTVDVVTEQYEVAK